MLVRTHIDRSLKVRKNTGNGGRNSKLSKDTMLADKSAKKQLVDRDELNESLTH
jgi:hypothetical protein